MKNVIIVGIVATFTLLTGCNQKAQLEAHRNAQRDVILTQTKEAVPASLMVGYAIADTSKSTNMVFTITEIWKVSKEGSALGLTNGMQIRYQYPSIASLPDAAIVTIPQGYSQARESRGMTFVRQGRVFDMTVQEFKTKIGL